MKRKDRAESGGAMGKLMADDCLRSKKKKRRRDFLYRRKSLLFISFDQKILKSSQRRHNIKTIVSLSPQLPIHIDNQWISIALQLISENVMDVFFFRKMKIERLEKGKTSF